MKSAATLVTLLGCMAVVPLPAAEPVLRIEGASGRDGVVKAALVFSIEDLAAMPRVTAKVRGRDNKERVYEGVLLSELLKRSGQPQGEELRGSLLAKYILAIAHDGYRVLFSLPEADPGFSDARIIVADMVDSKTLPDREGPLRIIIPSEKREARWIRMLEKIEITESPVPIR